MQLGLLHSVRPGEPDGSPVGRGNSLTGWVELGFDQSGRKPDLPVGVRLSDAGR